VITIAPADANELRAAMSAMIQDERPTYLRVTRDPEPLIFPEGHVFEIGTALVLREGTDVGIISTGTQTARSLQAVDLLAASGISAGLLHVPTLKPLDVEGIVSFASRSRAIVTTEDHSIIGGLGSAVAETLGEHHPTPLKRVGLMDVYGESGPNDALLEKYGLTANHVATAAIELLSRTAGS
jgi:transketolase